MEKELKTLKDIFKEHDREIERGDYWMRAFLNFNAELKQEAIKWIKYYRSREPDDYIHMKGIAIVDWLKFFFNLTEEELK